MYIKIYYSMKRMLGSEVGYTPDTCVLVKICENPNVGNLLNCRVNFEGSVVYLNSQSIAEADRLGYGLDQIYSIMKSTFGPKVVFGEITTPMLVDAKNMQRKCQTLHAGDAEILAFAKETCSTLVSCDKGLVEAAKEVGVSFINPDVLPCSEITRRPRSRWYRVVKDAVKTVNESPQKIKTPIRKITWEAFA